MRRKSTAFASMSTDSNESTGKYFKNTGLRPVWDEFWSVNEQDDSEEEIDDKNTQTVSTESSMKSDTTIKNVKFITGSEWYGEWGRLGMTGMGVFKMPHGVIYDGSMNAGKFEGIGVLRYPNGGSLEGLWHEGKLVKFIQYEFEDGLKRDGMENWSYCQMPDRRFHSEILQGLRASDQEQVSNEEPPREVPPGHYDIGYGFYNPRTKCVTDYHTGEVVRIPTQEEEEWILKNCRTDEIGTVGYRKDLYENWFADKPTDELNPKTDKPQRRPLTEEQKEILTLVLQEGGLFESRKGSQRESTEPRSMRLDPFSLQELRSLSSAWSQSTTTDLEGFLKNLIKERDERKLKKQPTLDSTSTHSQTLDVNSSDEISMIKLLQDITIRSSSGRIENSLYSADNISEETLKRLSKKKEVSETVLETQHLAGKAKDSDGTTTTMPFSTTVTKEEDSTDTVYWMQRSISENVGNSWCSQTEAEGATEESVIRLNIDYSDFTASRSNEEM